MIQFANNRAKTPKAGWGRWEGPIWEAIDAEAIRRTSITATFSSPPSPLSPTIAAASAVSNPHKWGVHEELGDDGWGADGDDGYNTAWSDADGTHDS